MAFGRTVRALVLACACMATLDVASHGQAADPRQGTADLGMSAQGVRQGPGLNAANASDDTYHSGAAVKRKRLLAWADVRNGYQHDSVSHALAVIERLGYETGAYDTFIRTDSQLITKHTVLASDGKPPLYVKNLNDFDAIFFFGVREIDLTAEQKKDLLSFVHDDGKGFVTAHSGATSFFSWPEFGDMVGGRFDEHPWGIVRAPVIVEDPRFPGMTHLPKSFEHTDEMYQIKDFSRDHARVLLRLDVSHLELKTNPLVHHQDQDFPLAWAKMYGAGRVYYSALGHDPSNWDDRIVQEMYFEAIKWALKLTDADIAPQALKAQGAATGSTDANHNPITKRTPGLTGSASVE